MQNFLLKVQNLAFKAHRYSDIYVAVLVVSIISLFVVPVPPWLLDTVIAVNLSLSMILLMMALYIPSVLAFSTFPSLLLLTTLFRLSINITSTRMILLDAHAGEIIFTFGSFVVADNFVVGLVVFLILLVVQYIVITKGAERVAEVAARFTLDAMPGKQMSIDADMRAGVIDLKEAQRRRGILEKESQLFGAMDGAMKFVKGDAIASLIIVAINLLAGFAIGVAQKGMELGVAVQTYSILSIGDGLVSQIPALLISITAGIIVTRVSNDEDMTGLGTDIIGQIFSVPKAMMIGGFVLLVFALIPGFPKIQFFALAAIAIGSGVFMQRDKIFKKKKGKVSTFLSSEEAKTQGAKGQPESASKEELAITVPLSVEVDGKLQEMVVPEELNQELKDVRKALYNDLGVPFPGIHLRFNESLDKGRYQILVQEVPMATGILRPNYLFVREKAEHLEAFQFPYEPVEKSPDGMSAFWVPISHLQRLTDANIFFLDTPKLLSFHISIILKRYGGEFIGLQETKTLLTKMEVEYGELIREVQRVMPVQRIAEVLQRLVQEDISIRNLRLIFQALIEWGAREKDPVMLTEYVRVALKRYISYKYSVGHNVLVAYLIEPAVEEQLRKAIRQTSAGSFLALEPAASKRLIDEIRRQIGEINATDRPPVLLTSMDLRRYTRKLIELDFPLLPVLSHQELTEEIQVQPLGRIGLT